MREQLEKIKSQALADIHAALDNVSLDAVRVRVLGKKGELTALLKQMEPDKTDKKTRKRKV